MVTNHNVQDATKNQPDLLRLFHLVRDRSINAENARLRDAVVENGRFWDAVWGLAWTVAGVGFLTTANGCLATRSWVKDQLNPITGQLARQESQLSDTDAKANRALTEMQNLRLERRLVLDSGHGPTFAAGSAALT